MHPFVPEAGQHLSCESILWNDKENILGFADRNLCSWEGQSKEVSDKYTKATQLAWFCPNSTEEEKNGWPYWKFRKIHMPENK